MLTVPLLSAIVGERAAELLARLVPAVARRQEAGDRLLTLLVGQPAPREQEQFGDRQAGVVRDVKIRLVTRHRLSLHRH